MKITVKHLERKEIEQSFDIEIPSYYKFGWSYYAILGEAKYIEARADEMGSFHLETWENKTMVGTIVKEKQSVTAELFHDIALKAKNGIDVAFSELSMLEFVTGSEKATPTEIRKEAEDMQPSEIN